MILSYFELLFSVRAPFYFFLCPLYLRSCGVLKNGESFVPVESDVVCSVFVSSPEIMDISSPLTIISGTSYYTPEQ